jgi:hypothetical protein
LSASVVAASTACFEVLCAHSHVASSVSLQANPKSPLLMHVFGAQADHKFTSMQWCVINSHPESPNSFDVT